MKILGDTASLPAERREYDKDSLHQRISDQLTLPLISSTHEFGFTLGAPKEVLECISAATALETRLSEPKPYEHFERDLVQILSKLSVYQQAVPSSGCDQREIESQARSTLEAALNVQNQKMAFVSATHIYLYRTLFDLPLARLRPYVSRTFERVSGVF